MKGDDMMKMSAMTLFMLFSLSMPAGAGELLLGAAGKSNYQIVVPDKFPDQNIEKSVNNAASLLQQAFAENAITIPVAVESKADKSKPGIYLGSTEFAEKNGVKTAGMSGWSYIHKVVGKNVVVAGNDRPDALCEIRTSGGNAPTKRPLPYEGTYKGVTDFLRQYAGVRFLSPRKNGVEFLPTPSIFIPSDLNVSRSPYADTNDFWTASSNDVFYVANHLMPFQNVKDYYGHQHPRSVPVEKYWKDHPEYFILKDGVRGCMLRGYNGKRIGHLCLSNPEVQELIYKQVLADCDEGYDIVELGQGDGFMNCQCAKCADMYGIKPSAEKKDLLSQYNDPAWGEKIWILHRSMAERLMKDRPGKKLMIIAYGPTVNPPKTFSGFPENVIIEMAKHSPESFAAWNKIKVPGGYAAYVYNWGVYHLGGFTPMRTLKGVGDQVKGFIENNVRIVRTHGFGELPGLEGPNQYVYLRMLDDAAGLSPEALMEEYIQASYREAADPMRKFFAILQKRVALYELIEKQTRDPLNVLSAIHTPDLLDSLETELSRAEKTVKSERAKSRLATLRGEFDYLKLTANAIHMYYAWMVRKDKTSFEMAIDSVAARNEWIDKLPSSKNAEAVSESSPAFPMFQKNSLKTNRYLNRAPFNWDVNQLRADSASGGKAKEKAMTVKQLTVRKSPGPASMSSPAWKQATSYELENKDRKDLEAKTKFQVMYDQENLYLLFDAELPKEEMKYSERGRDGELWLQECIDFSLSPSGDREKRYHFAFDPVPNSSYDAANGFITDTLHPFFGKDDITWNGLWKYENKLLPERNRWLAFVTVPYKTLDVSAPKKGDSWVGNFGRVHFYGENRKEQSMWSGQGIGSNCFDKNTFGELVFE